EVTRAYQASVPELADRFAQYDLFAPEFALSCLNRLQLRDNRQMVDLADPSAALQLVGTLQNPLAGRGPQDPAGTLEYGPRGCPPRRWNNRTMAEIIQKDGTWTFDG